jgi:predicted amidohydrolase
MISKIGFFHFGANYADPIGELGAELALAHRDAAISESLIVLPEAFNIRKDYREILPRCDTNPAIIFELQTLSKQFKVAFVAGLIVDDAHHVVPPYSAAYLIDATRSKVVCYKQCSDKMACRNYSPCAEECDLHNPTEYKGVSVGVLICMDAFTQSEGRERRARLKQVAAKIVCVPSNFYQARHNVDVPAMSRQWPGALVVLANSNASGIGSLIVDGDGKEVASWPGPSNKIKVVQFGSAHAAG